MLVDASLRNNAWLFEKWMVWKKIFKNVQLDYHQTARYIHFLLKTNMFLPCAIASLSSRYNSNIVGMCHVELMTMAQKKETPSPSTRAESSVKKE